VVRVLAVERFFPSKDVRTGCGARQPYSTMGNGRSFPGPDAYRWSPFNLRGMYMDNLVLLMARVKSPWHFQDDTLGNVGKVNFFFGVDSVSNSSRKWNINNTVQFSLTGI
jgi:hypothetical protein